MSTDTIVQWIIHSTSGSIAIDVDVA